MCLGIEPTKGKAVVIEYVRKGEHHRSVRWTTDKEFIEEMIKCGTYAREVIQQYSKAGVDVLSVAALDIAHSELICLD